MAIAAKEVTSRLVQSSRGRFEAWADELSAQSGTVLAISRKGPRLLELLVREGLLPSTFMNRVISELALPFIEDLEGDLVIIDDAVTHGSTYAKTYKLADETRLRWKSFGQSKLIGMPFAVSEKANKDYLNGVSKHFLNLEADKVSAFVYSEVSAFKLLSKPFDLEHPILTFSGDFINFADLEIVLEQITTQLQGELIPLHTKIPTANGVIENKAWTVLLKPNADNSIRKPAFCKLRLYLNQEATRLNLVAMQPVALSKKNLEELDKVLPKELAKLWPNVKSLIDNKSHDDLVGRASYRSLVMWANFLNSILLLRVIKDVFHNELSISGFDVWCNTPCREDLQLLVGPMLAGKAEKIVKDFLSEPFLSSDSISNPLSPLHSNLMEEKFLEHKNDRDYYKNLYQEALKIQLEQAKDIDDALKSIFHTQHRKIELPSREFEQEDGYRLDFGLTYAKLRETVLEKFHEVRSLLEANNIVDKIIHQCLDELIDDGCIVPRYINMSRESDEPVWVRAFRVGEGPILHAEQTIRVLFENLSSALNLTEKVPKVPKVLFEEFCVLVLLVAENKNLLPLKHQRLVFEKDFCFDRARCNLKIGLRKIPLLDWAVDHRILTFFENSDSYSLDADLDNVYPKSESPWNDEDLKHDLEDLASLVAVVYAEQDFRDDALTVFTSLASKKELHKLLEAKLDTWLNDHHFSIYHCIKLLAKLAATLDRDQVSEIELNSARENITQIKIFLDQVDKYQQLEANKEESVYNRVDALMKRETPKVETAVRRIWDSKLRRTLTDRLEAEKSAPDLNRILSAIRVAAQVNQILEDILGLAENQGSQEKEQSFRSSVRSVSEILENASDQIDIVTRDVFKEKRESQLENIPTLLSKILQQNELFSFKQAFDLTLPVILEIADCFDIILNRYGSEGYREDSEILEPPQYIVMWDVKGSTGIDSRDPLERTIATVYRQIPSDVKDFRAESRDDGNGLICRTFDKVLVVFTILADGFQSMHLRAGCEVNLQGRLNYFPKSKSLSGRAYEHTARIRDMFKEIEKEPVSWSGENPSEPQSSYLIVGEFARRFAKKEGVNLENRNDFKIIEPEGVYKARVSNSLPISVSIVVPRA